MSLSLEFYSEVYPQQPVDGNSLRFAARLLAGRTHETAVTSTGSPEAMVSSQTAWSLPGKPMDSGK